MAALKERVVLPEGFYRIEWNDNGEYLLQFGDVVEYRNGMKRVRGRKSAYEFRSVEQLRYDFERDAEAA